MQLPSLFEETSLIEYFVPVKTGMDLRFRGKLLAASYPSTNSSTEIFQMENKKFLAVEMSTPDGRCSYKVFDTKEEILGFFGWCQEAKKLYKELGLQTEIRL
jgi:hypothetical protein